MSLRTAHRGGSVNRSDQVFGRHTPPDLPRLSEIHFSVASLAFAAAGLDDRLNRTFAGPRFYAIALGLFAALALSTAILGVYGVLAYLVERRRIEFGVRRALGAGERQISWLVFSQSLRLSVTGPTVGLLTAASGAGLMRSLLFGVRPVDPVTFAGAAGLIVLVAAGAAWYPSLRALRVDPAEALRME